MYTASSSGIQIETSFTLAANIWGSPIANFALKDSALWAAVTPFGCANTIASSVCILDGYQRQAGTTFQTGILAGTQRTIINDNSA